MDWAKLSISRISSGFEFIASRPGILGQLPVQFSISPPRIIGQLTGVMVLIKAISFFTSSIRVKSAKDIPMREKLLTSSSFSISLTEGLTNSRGLHPRFLNILCAIKLPGKALDFKIPGITFDTHLFGVKEGGIHLFGTDKAGKDLFSRTLSAIYISLAVGTVGVFISFVLSLIIGGISGYYGGWIEFGMTSDEIIILSC